MKKTTLIISTVGLMLMFASCEPTQFIEKYGYDENTAKTISPTSWGFSTPLTMDIVVSPTKISHTETFKNKLTRSDIIDPKNSSEIEFIKEYTIANAIKNNNADILIAPIFNIKTDSDYNTITVEVSGYPAHYTNFRKATLEDLKMHEYHHSKNPNTPSTLYIEGAENNLMTPKTTK